MKMNFQFAKAYRLYFDGDADGDPTVTVTPPVVKPDDKPRTFTQDEVNNLLAEDRRKHQATINKQVEQLTQLQKAKGLSEKEKADFAARIEELQNSLLTKEQLAAKEKEKFDKEFKTTVQGLTTERDTWQSRFVNSTINSAIVSEASKAEAFDPDAIIALLGKNTTLAEEKDEDGNGLDIFTPRVKFKDVDKDGKAVTLDLTVEQAVKRMKDIEKYGYLFRSTAKGGLGADGGTKAGKAVDISKMTHEQYLKHRKTEGLGRKPN